MSGIGRYMIRSISPFGARFRSSIAFVSSAQLYSIRYEPA